jgi:hypothetical protein
MRTWRDCVSVSLPMGTSVSTSIRPPDGQGPVSSAGRAETGHVQRWPMSTSPDWIITVSIANGRSISSSKNGTMRGGSLSQRVLMVTIECR